MLNDDKYTNKNKKKGIEVSYTVFWDTSEIEVGMQYFKQIILQSKVGIQTSSF